MGASQEEARRAVLYREWQRGGGVSCGQAEREAATEDVGAP